MQHGKKGRLIVFGKKECSHPAAYDVVTGSCRAVVHPALTADRVIVFLLADPAGSSSLPRKLSFNSSLVKTKYRSGVMRWIGLMNIAGIMIFHQNQDNTGPV